MSKLPALPLQQFLNRLFRALGAPESVAATVATSLWEAELCGHPSHGLIRVCEYAREIRSGAVCPTAIPSVQQELGGVVVVDGAGGFGAVAAHHAVDLLRSRLPSLGVAAAAVRNCGHLGRAGDYPAALARAGWIGLAMVSGGGRQPRVAPFGARQPLFGTNPIAMAFPADPPVVADFSTAAVASGKIRLLHRAGQPLPEGWILDQYGRPSTNSQDYYEGGMLQAMAGHKGSALSLMVELLAGILTGNGSAVVEGSGYQGGNGLLLVGIDPAAFGPVDRLIEQSAQLLRRVRSAPPVEPEAGVCLPGEPEYRQMQAGLAQGVEVTESTWQEVLALAGDLQVDWELS